VVSPATATADALTPAQCAEDWSILPPGPPQALRPRHWVVVRRVPGLAPLHDPCTALKGLEDEAWVGPFPAAIVGFASMRVPVRALGGDASAAHADVELLVVHDAGGRVTLHRWPDIATAQA
jgi:hypothetical protein